MNENLKRIIDEYCDEFLNQDKVKKYLLLEKCFNESQEIINKQNKLKNSQKKLALSIGDDIKHKEALEEYNLARKDFDEDPLIANYLLLKEEILKDINQLKTKLDS